MSEEWDLLLERAKWKWEYSLWLWEYYKWLWEAKIGVINSEEKK